MKGAIPGMPDEFGRDDVPIHGIEEDDGIDVRIGTGQTIGDAADAYYGLNRGLWFQNPFDKGE
jgi:hypothetical protein